MSKANRNRLSEIMCKAWYLARTYGLSMSEALRHAWAWFKLRLQMTLGVVEFFYHKSDGSKRQAFGTLRADMLPKIKGAERKHYDHLQIYFDTEKGEFRSFKIINMYI